MNMRTRNPLISSNAGARVLLALAACWLALAGCAAPRAESPAGKVGMHIDAVLRFAVEHPLDWPKQRRVPFGGRDGEVSWTDPEQPGTRLLVASTRTADPAETIDRRVARLAADDPGLQLALQEQVELPAGTAWHLAGQTRQGDIELYLIAGPGRSYRLALIKAHGELDGYEDLLRRVAESFQALP